MSLPVPQRLDRILGEMVSALPSQTTLMITADHGHREVQPQHLIPILWEAEFQALLGGPVAGEERVAYLRALPKYHSEICQRLTSFAEVLDADEAWQAGCFGPPSGSPFRARVGDLIVLPHGALALSRPFAHAHSERMRGLHGGASELERVIPLITFSPALKEV